MYHFSEPVFATSREKIFNFVHVLKRPKIASDYMGATHFFSENFQLCRCPETSKNRIKSHWSVTFFFSETFQPCTCSETSKNRLRLVT